MRGRIGVYILILANLIHFLPRSFISCINGYLLLGYYCHLHKILDILLPIFLSNTGNSPEDHKNTRKNLGCSLEDLKDARENLGCSPEDLKDTRKNLGCSPEDLNDARENLGYSLEDLNDARENLGYSPEDLGDTRENLGYSPEDLKNKSECYFSAPICFSKANWVSNFCLGRLVDFFAGFLEKHGHFISEDTHAGDFIAVLFDCRINFQSFGQGVAIHCHQGFLETVGQFFALVGDRGQVFGEAIISFKFGGIEDFGHDLPMILNSQMSLFDKGGKAVGGFE